MKQTSTPSIEEQIATFGSRPFSARDILRLSAAHSRASIDMALSRLAEKGKIRRLRRGLYDHPEQHPLGALPADPVEIAMALGRAEGAMVVPNQAYAANALGLSQQVPARSVFLTTGRSRKVTIGKRTIELRHSSPRRLRTADPFIALVIGALRDLGKDRVTHETIQTLRTRISAVDRHRLLDAIPDAPTWMQPHFRALAMS